MDPTTLLLLLSALSAGGSLFSAGQSSTPSLTKSDRASFRRPGEQNLVGDLLLAEAALQLGADPQAIAEDYAIRQVEQNANPSIARIFSQELDNLKRAVAAGDQQTATALVQRLNRTLTIAHRNNPSFGGQVRIEGDGIAFQFADPAIQGVLDEATTHAEAIREARGSLLEQIPSLAAGLPDVSEESIRGREGEIESALLARLEDDLSLRSEEIIERANKLGISPSGELGQLEREALLRRGDITSEGALRRALTLLGGETELGRAGIEARQLALLPTMADPALSALSMGNQTQTAGLGLAMQLAIASAEAESARTSSLANALGSLSAVGIQGADILSSSDLQTELGRIPPPSNYPGGIIRGR